MSPEFRTALLRAAYGGLLIAAASFLGSYSQSSNVKGSALVAAGALVAYLIARGGVEGYVDTQRSKP